MKEHIKKQILFALAAIAIVGVSAVLAAWLTDTQSEWYLALQKPSIQPPPEAFGIVWPVLYGLLAISLYILLKEGAWKGRLRLLFLATLLLLPLWNLVFFINHQIASGLLVLVATVVSAILTAVYAKRESKLAFWLLVPLILWLLFATALNYMIFMMN